jgi:Fibronectin type III domain
MSQYISSIALAALTTLSAMSLATTADAATVQAANINSQDSNLASPPLFPTLASTPNLTATCRGEPKPCITRPDAHQSGNSIIFTWSGAGDVYNVRYRLASGGEKQVENRTARYTFKNVKPNRSYTISVQACVKNFLAESSCTAWKTASFTTR